MWTAEKTEALNALLARLDNDQKHVAAWRPQDGNMRVVACAGAGKTTTTVALAADLVRSGAVAPEGIVLTTFSKKAGEELKSRLARVTPAPVLERMRVGTFHGLALRAMKAVEASRWDVSKCVDLDGRTRAQGIPASSALWRSICAFGTIPGTNRPSLKCEDGRPTDYSMAIDLLRAKGYTRPSDVTDADAPGLDKWERAWLEYTAAKNSLGAWDFTDLLAAWLDALRTGVVPADAAVCVVDEAQDNNRVQLEIAQSLTGAAGRIILVGDLRQTIHVWRGSFPDLFQHADRAIGAHTREIPTNYRSLGPIVALGNKIAHGRDWSLGAAATAHRGARDRDDVIEILAAADDPQSEAMIVADRIADDIDAGKGPASFAILARTNAARAYFEAALTAKNIPIAVLGGSSIFRTREAEVILAYCALAQHDAVGSLERVLNAPKRFLPTAFAHEVRAALGRGGMSLPQAIRAAAYGGTLKRGSQNGASDLAMTIERLRALPWAKVPDTVLTIVQAAQAEISEADATDEDSPALYAAVVAIAKRFDCAADLIDFAQRCINGTAALVEGQRGEGRVTLSTVHRSKGLEWDHVYVSATDGVFPHANALLTSIEDERRLFYVAATRAVDRLTFTYSQRAGRSAGGLCRFLTE